MKDMNLLLAAFLLLIAAIFVTESALAENESIANASLSASTGETELVSFVESAVAYTKENGKDMALKEFSP